MIIFKLSTTPLTTWYFKLQFFEQNQINQLDREKFGIEISTRF